MRGRRALLAFLGFCLVSLFADMTYEGGRSFVGPYLGILGAPAIAIGILSIGDLLNYSMRGVSGLLGYKFYSRRFLSALTALGYFINLLAVPLLAIAGNWQIAFILVLLERFGKGLRTSPRDVFLAEVTKEIGRGKGFGIHEVMDQVGAFIGPLLVSYGIYSTSSYRFAFKILAIPAGISLAFLILALSLAFLKRGSQKEEAEKGKIPKLMFASLFFYGLGFPHWILFSYLLKYWSILIPSFIAASFALAMAADAAIAIPVGILAEKRKYIALILAPLLSLIFPLFMILPSLYLAVFCAICWGLSLGAFEVASRVLIAENFKGRKKSIGYGLIGVFFGGGWAIGNALMGAFLSSPLILSIYSLCCLAISVLLVTFGELKGKF